MPLISVNGTDWGEGIFYFCFPEQAEHSLVENRVICSEWFHTANTHQTQSSECAVLCWHCWKFAGSSESTLGLILGRLLSPCSTQLCAPVTPALQRFGEARGAAVEVAMATVTPPAQSTALPTQAAQHPWGHLATFPPITPILPSRAPQGFVQLFSLFGVSAFAESHTPVVWRLRALKQPWLAFHPFPRRSTAGNCPCSGQEAKVRNVELPICQQWLFLGSALLW